MPGVIAPCLRRLSAISARPLRAAEPRRSMLSDEGGVGTMSSRVRRARSSCGRFTVVGGAAAADLGARVAFARGAGALRAAFLGAAFRPGAFLPAARLGAA